MLPRGKLRSARRCRPSPPRLPPHRRSRCGLTCPCSPRRRSGPAPRAGAAAPRAARRPRSRRRRRGRWAGSSARASPGLPAPDPPRRGGRAAPSTLGPAPEAFPAPRPTGEALPRVLTPGSAGRHRRDPVRSCRDPRAGGSWGRGIPGHSMAPAPPRPRRTPVGARPAPLGPRDPRLPPVLPPQPPRNPLIPSPALLGEQDPPTPTPGGSRCPPRPAPASLTRGNPTRGGGTGLGGIQGNRSGSPVQPQLSGPAAAGLGCGSGFRGTGESGSGPWRAAAVTGPRGGTRLPLPRSRISAAGEPGPGH